MSSLIYSIYGLCTTMERFQLPSAPLVLQFGIHQGQAGRKRVRGTKEERWRGGGGWKARVVRDFISPPSQNGQQAVLPML
jgi:hypothetical protein